MLNNYPLIYLSENEKYFSYTHDNHCITNFYYKLLRTGNETEEPDCEPDYDCDADYDGDNVARKFPDDERCNRDIVGNTFTVQSIILQR